MKRKSVAIVLLVSFVVGVVSADVGTSFTYQGRFKDGANWANGQYTFLFKLYDHPNIGEGIQKGSDYEVTLDVTDGYFTADLNFGAGTDIFPGEPRWLQIAVDGGSGYVTLTPRRELKPAPYAMYADKGIYTNIFEDAEGDIGIGTDIPAYPLHLEGKALIAQGVQNAEPLRLQGYPIANENSAQDIVFSNPGAGEAKIRSFRGGSLDTYLQFITNSSGGTSDVRLHVDASGCVGIASTIPSEKLDVNGNVRCVTLYETSDERLKSNFEPLTGVLDKLAYIRGGSYWWNEDADAVGAQTGAKDLGVLASEVEQVFPELVRTPDADRLQARVQSMQDNQRPHYKAVSYSKLTVVLLEAVKELKAENDALKQRVAALEGK